MYSSQPEESTRTRSETVISNPAVILQLLPLSLSLVFRFIGEPGTLLALKTISPLFAVLPAPASPLQRCFFPGRHSRPAEIAETPVVLFRADCALRPGCLTG